MGESRSHGLRTLIMENRVSSYGYPEGYCVMQVCENGHAINDDARGVPARNKLFCTKCGAATRTACPECSATIQGAFRNSMGMRRARSIPPNNCHNCGAAYPWRRVEIATAIEVLQLELEEDDAAQIPGLVADVATDTPRTQLAALKLKRFLPAFGKASYDVAIKVISDIASETAKKALGLTPHKP